MKKYDVIIIGCGAAGLSAARAALTNKRSVLILDMGERPARKVLVSGGGRCNFTNLAVGVNRYFGKNPDFVRSALSKVKPSDILDWAKSHRLNWVEKSPGQFFCATNSADFVEALISDVNLADIKTNTFVTDIEKKENKFIVKTKKSDYECDSVIVATGGISYPALDVSDFGYMIAKKFGHKIIPTRPALISLKTPAFSPELSGISINVEIKIGKNIISDSLLFTHSGIGGPAAYRASLYEFDNGIYINFLPGLDIYKWIMDSKKIDGKKSLQTILMTKMTRNLAKWFSKDITKNIADLSGKEVLEISKRLSEFYIPGNNLTRLGMQNAEVTFGGISTEFISSKTMESKLCPGLYFVGEVLDIAGDLGGFNLHFAFASGLTAGGYA